MSMADQYSRVGEEFQKTASRLLLRTALLTPAFISMAGDLHGSSCLDLACGDGYYTRLLRTAGADRVVGVDASEKMIQLAEVEEEKLGQGIEYLRGDVAHLPQLGEFDLVTTVFLLHYARSEDELREMCRSIFRSVSESGRFLTINTNPEHPIREDTKYSFTRTSETPLREGGELVLSHYDDDELKYSLTFYHWSKETYERALSDAGFSSVEWYVPHPSLEAVESHGEEFWHDYDEHPNHSIIVCHR